MSLIYVILISEPLGKGYPGVLISILLYVMQNQTKCSFLRLNNLAKISTALLFLLLAFNLKMYNKYLIQENTRVLNNEETIYFPEEYNAALTYDVGGHILWTDWHDNSVSDYVRKNGVWEYNMLGLWGHLFKRGQNVVVVGAHIGTHLVHIADLVGPEGQIYCFEPNPFTYEILHANWVLNNMTNVRLYNKALSNQNGNMSFVIDYPNSGGSFLLSGNYTPPSHLNKINVQIMKLDDMLKDVGQIDVIQMDAEGVEWMIGEGGVEILKKNYDITVVMEWEQENIRRYTSDFTKIIEWWESLGFKILMIKTDRVDKIYDLDLKYISGNILLTRRPEKWMNIKLK